MVNKSIIPLIAAALLVSGCDETANSLGRTHANVERVTTVDIEEAPENQFGFYEAEATGPDFFGENVPTARDNVRSLSNANRESTDSQEQAESSNAKQLIAYTYGFGFQIDADKISNLQQAHIAMCEDLGDACRILRMSEIQYKLMERLR